MKTDHATKQDLKDALALLREALAEHADAVEVRVMRSIEGYVRASEARFRALEGATAALMIADHAMLERLAALENRLLEIELRMKPPS